MPDRLPAAELVHAMPGRSRLRVPDRRGDAVFFAAVATGLSALPGIFHVDVRPLTGSIVVRHAGPVERLGAAAEAARLFVLRPAAAPSPAAPAPRLGPRAAVAAGAGLFALWQLSRGQVLPPAVTLAWYAASLWGLLSEGAAPDED